MSEIHDAHALRKGESSAEIEAGLLAIVRERAERHDADVIGQVLTVSSAMNALGAETLAGRGEASS